MSEESYNSDSSSTSSSSTKKSIIPAWEVLFENGKKGKHMVLDNLLNKKVKVWSVLADTVNGIRGTWKGQVGILTAFDDEFIIIDNTIVISRKFIYRIEIL